MRVLLLCLVLCSCVNQPKPVEVPIPVAQPCLKNRPVTPSMKFDKLPIAKSDKESAEQVRVLWDDRQTLLELVNDWQTAASGCQVVQ